MSPLPERDPTESRLFGSHSKISKCFSLNYGLYTFYTGSFALVSGLSGCAYEPFKRDFLFIPYSSIIFLEVTFIGLQTRYSGCLSLLCRILQFGCLMWSSTPLILRNKYLWGSSWLCIAAAGVHFCSLARLCLCPSFPSWCCPFTLFVEALFIQFSGLFRRNYTLYSYRFVVSMGGGEFRTFLLYHLESLYCIFL